MVLLAQYYCYHNFLSHFRRQMVWTGHHDILLLREILAAQPWIHRHGSTERGQSWDGISAILGTIEEPVFKGSTRSVRDRYTLLVKKYKTRRNEDLKASGSNPEHTELDDALQDLIERFEEADNIRKVEKAEKAEKAETELALAQEVRNKSLETFSQTQKRKGIDQPQSSKKRRSSVDTVNFLREKSEREHTLKQEELQIKRQEIELQKQQLQQSNHTQNAQIQMMQQQNIAILEILKSLKQ